MSNCCRYKEDITMKVFGLWEITFPINNCYACDSEEEIAKDCSCRDGFYCHRGKCSAYGDCSACDEILDHKFVDGDDWGCYLPAENDNEFVQCTTDYEIGHIMKCPE